MWNALQCRIWTAISVALLGPLQYGMALSIVNTMLEPLSEDLNFKKEIGGAVATAALYFGAVLGGLASRPFERFLGKYSQIVIGIFYTCGSLLCGLAIDRKVCWGGPFNGCVPEMILSGRVLIGFASGLMLVISPKYLAEVSPPAIRGGLGACVQLCIAMGVFLGLLIGLPYSFDSFAVGYSWWRIMFLFGCIPSLLQTLLMFFTFPLYETTRADLRKSFKGHLPETSGDHQIIEMSDLTCPTNSDSRSVESKPAEDVSNTEPAIETMLHKMLNVVRSFSILFDRRYRHSVFLGIGVPVAGRLIGINVLGSYSTAIFRDAGFDQAVVASILYGLGNVMASGISVVLFDKCGRTSMAYLSFAGMGISYLALAFSNLATKSIAGPLSVVFVVAFILSYGAGCGALTMSYPPEVVPPEISGIVLGTGQSMSVTVALILVLVFPSVFSTLGAFWSFLMLFSFCLGSLAFLKVYMVETKGRSLEEIMDDLTGL